MSYGNLTREEAVKLLESGFWSEMTFEQRAKFQLYEKRLCMPFSVFQEAIEKTLGRSVREWEFAEPDHLKLEMLGESPAPTLEDIMNLIPGDKRVLITH